jgi:hypothetical protein
MTVDDGWGEDVPVRDALDTLPMNAAVVDEDGEILFTNRAWREFAAANEAVDDARADTFGANYFAATDTTGDVYARNADDGLRAVLAGEREQFSLEYPCHSEDEKRWFLMRANRFLADGRPHAVVVHVDITERKLAELTAEHRAAELKRERTSLEHLLNRLNGLVQDVLRVLVQATSREEMERAVCERLAETEPYELAWIGARNLPGDRLEVREHAGSLPFEPEELRVSLDADAPSARALREREIQIVDSAEELRRTLPGDGALADEVGAVVAVPLAYRESLYGVLTVYTERGHGIDERERVILEALSAAIANAANALEHKRLLTADEVIELEISVRDPAFPFCALSERADCRLQLTGTVQRDDGSVRQFVLAEGGRAADVGSLVGELPEVTSATTIAEHDDEWLYELVVSDSPAADLVDFGAITTSISAEGGQARVRLELSRQSDARAAFEHFEGRYEGVELLAHRQHERPARTRPEFVAALTDRLTDRQLTALRSAYLSGYFDWPRPVSGKELSASMDIDRSTFHQHLRAAQRKLLEQLFDGDW